MKRRPICTDDPTISRSREWKTEDSDDHEVDSDLLITSPVLSMAILPSQEEDDLGDLNNFDYDLKYSENNLEMESEVEKNSNDKEDDLENLEETFEMEDNLEDVDAMEDELKYMEMEVDTQQMSGDVSDDLKDLEESWDIEDDMN